MYRFGHGVEDLKDVYIDDNDDDESVKSETCTPLTETENRPSVPLREKYCSHGTIKGSAHCFEQEGPRSAFQCPADTARMHSQCQIGILNSRPFSDPESVDRTNRVFSAQTGGIPTHSRQIIPRISANSRETVRCVSAPICAESTAHFAGQEVAASWNGMICGQKNHNLSMKNVADVHNFDSSLAVKPWHAGKSEIAQLNEKAFDTCIDKTPQLDQTSPLVVNFVSAVHLNRDFPKPGSPGNSDEDSSFSMDSDSLWLINQKVSMSEISDTIKLPEKFHTLCSGLAQCAGNKEKACCQAQEGHNEQNIVQLPQTDELLSESEDPLHRLTSPQYKIGTDSHIMKPTVQSLIPSLTCSRLTPEPQHQSPLQSQLHQRSQSQIDANVCYDPQHSQLNQLFSSFSLGEHGIEQAVESWPANVDVSKQNKGFFQMTHSRQNTSGPETHPSKVFALSSCETAQDKLAKEMAERVLSYQSDIEQQQKEAMEPETGNTPINHCYPNFQHKWDLDLGQPDESGQENSGMRSTQITQPVSGLVPLVTRLNSGSEPSVAQYNVGADPSVTQYDAGSELPDTQYDVSSELSDTQYNAGLAPSVTHYDAGSKPSDTQCDAGSEPSVAQYNTGSTPSVTHYNAGLAPSVNNNASSEPSFTQYDAGLEPSETQYKAGSAPSVTQYNASSDPSETQYDADSAPSVAQYNACSEPSDTQYDAGSEPLDTQCDDTGPEPSDTQYDAGSEPSVNTPSEPPVTQFSASLPFQSVPGSVHLGSKVNSSTPSAASRMYTPCVRPKLPQLDMRTKKRVKSPGQVDGAYSQQCSTVQSSPDLFRKSDFMDQFSRDSTELSHFDSPIVGNHNLSCHPIREQTWAEIDLASDVFQRTSAFENACDVIKECSRVLIVGQPGSGKKTVGRALLRHFEKYGWTPLIIKTFEEWRKHVGSSHQIVLLEHIFGKYDLKVSVLEQWQKLFEQMVSFCENGSGHVKLVFTFYPHILKELRHQTRKICHLFSDQYKVEMSFSDKEKQQILHAYLKKSKAMIKAKGKLKSFFQGSQEGQAEIEGSEGHKGLFVLLEERILKIDDSGTMFPECCCRLVETINTYVAPDDPLKNESCLEMHLEAAAKIFSNLTPIYCEFVSDLLFENRRNEFDERCRAAFTLLLEKVDLTQPQMIAKRCTELGFSSVCSQDSLRTVLMKFQGILVMESNGWFVFINRHAYEGTALALAHHDCSLVVKLADWRFIVKRCQVPTKGAKLEYTRRPFLLEVKRACPQGRCKPEYTALVCRIAHGLTESADSALLAVQHPVFMFKSFVTDLKQELGDELVKSVFTGTNTHRASLLYWALFFCKRLLCEWIFKTVKKMEQRFDKQDLILAAHACCVLDGNERLLNMFLKYWEKVTLEPVDNLLNGIHLSAKPVLMPLPNVNICFNADGKNQLKYLRSFDFVKTNWKSQIIDIEGSYPLTACYDDLRDQVGPAELQMKFLNISQPLLCLAATFNNKKVVNLLLEKFPHIFNGTSAIQQRAFEIAEHHGHIGIMLTLMPGCVMPTDLQENRDSL